jgi:prepilin-type N-terminal cleavage/methylation domain-containing protein
VRRDHRGFTLIELLIVAVVLGILTAIAITNFGNSKERAVVAAMKTDLRNLVSAEEAFHSSSQVYYGGAVPDPTMPFDPSEKVTITLSSVSATGWAAEAAHASTSKTCAIFMGSATPIAPATIEGRVACTL